MPIRKVPKNYRNVTGLAAAGKSVGAAQFESTLERDFLAILEFAPEVERFEVQPLKIEWRDGSGIARTYTPDVLVEFKQDTERPPWLCEVKYRADIKKNWHDLHPKFLCAIRYAKQRGWRFRLVTEREIRTPYLTNVRFLAPFRFREIPEADIEPILAMLRSIGKTTPASLVQSLSTDAWHQAERLPVIWHLMAHHRIGADLQCELTMDSTIWSVP
jgi:hypothetical protein